MTTRRFVSLLAFTVGLLAARPAVAQQNDASPDREWYGWQSAGLGAGAGLVFVSGLAARSDALAVTGAFAFAFASPISHWVRGNTGEGFGALALNVGLPFASIMAVAIPGALIGQCRGDDCVNYSLVFGMAIALAIDAGALSWRERERRPFLARTGVAPFVAPSQDQLVVGMSWTS